MEDTKIARKRNVVAREICITLSEAFGDFQVRHACKNANVEPNFGHYFFILYRLLHRE